MTGGVIGGWITDKYGRKKALILAAILNLTVISALWTVDSTFSFAVLRLMLGTVYSFSSAVPNSYAVEIFNIKYRGKILLVLNIMLTIGKVLSSYLAAVYLGKDLRLLEWKPVIYISAIGELLALLLLFCFLKESPRYLIA